MDEFPFVHSDAGARYSLTAAEAVEDNSCGRFQLCSVDIMLHRRPGLFALNFRQVEWNGQMGDRKDHCEEKYIPDSLSRRRCDVASQLLNFFQQSPHFCRPSTPYSLAIVSASMARPCPGDKRGEITRPQRGFDVGTQHSPVDVFVGNKLCLAILFCSSIMLESSTVSICYCSRFNVDLDLPPKQRWTQISKQYSQQIKDLIGVRMVNKSLKSDTQV